MSIFPVVPRPAATLVLVRDAAIGLEVLVGRRHRLAKAFPGAVVFPGGKLEAGDALAEEANDVDRDRDAAPCGARFAAIRETFEETGLLIADSGWAPPPDVDVAEARRAVEAGEIGFATLLERWGAVPGLTRLAVCAHWITPPAARHRFDTWFFVAQASEAEAGAPLICGEFETVFWAAPGEVLRRHGRALLPPTCHSLERLEAHADVASALAAARREPVFDGHAAEWPGVEGAQS